MKKSISCLLIFSLLLMTSCYSTRVIKDPVEIKNRNYTEYSLVNIKTNSDSEYKLKKVTVEGETLTGVEKNGKIATVKINEISKVSCKKFSAVSTIFATLLSAGLLGVIAVFIAWGSLRNS
jgi:hypothetical protein